MRERRLFADGHAVPLGSRALDVLVALMEHAGQVVSRNDLIDRVWPDADVQDNNLNVQISSLRKVLGSQLIATVPGRGYSFTPHLQPCTMPPADAAPAPLASNLPATLVALFGREGDEVELDRLVETYRLVTLIGPGGIGKTLLAQHLLRRHERRFRHGVCFVELSDVTDAAGIVGSIASTLQIRPAAGDVLDELIRAMTPLEVMLMLDNAEHLGFEVAEVVLALDGAVPGLRLVVTSQAPLKLAAERLFRVGPLSVPDRPLAADEAMKHGAIALFVDRARAADSRFVLTDAAALSAIAVCQALDGLPLAIELAAWRAPILGERRLADTMHEPLKLLVATRVGTPQRLQTLRHALAWSHDLLGPMEQQVLRRMSVLQGSTDLALIQAIAADPADAAVIDEWAVVDALSTLVERSLVSAVSDVKSGMRYRLLAVPKAFAREQLVNAGEKSLVQRRRAQALACRFATAYEKRFGGHERLNDWEERCLPDIDNGQAALAWLHDRGEADMALTLLPALMLATPKEERGRHAEMLTIGLQLVAGAAENVNAMRTLIEASYLIMTSDPSRRRTVAELAVEMARRCVPRCPDPRWLYRALCQRAIIQFIDDLTDPGEASLREARALEDAEWPAIFREHRWLAEVWLADRRGDGEGMYSASLRQFSLAHEAGPSAWASGLTMANSALAAGRAEDAVRHGLAVVAQLEGTRRLAGLAEIRTLLVAALIECGRLDEARMHSRAVWPLVGRFNCLFEWLDYQALLVANEGRLKDAALLTGLSDRIYARGQLERTFNELNATRRTRQLLSAGLQEGELNEHLHRGAGLVEEEIATVAFGLPHGE